MEASKRIKQLRRNIIKEVPKFPNDKQSKAALEAMSVGSLLIVFLSWRMRFVPEVPRLVTIADSAKLDGRWPGLQSQIKPFLEKVRKGTDLTPHLSLGAWRKGYTPAAAQPGKVSDRWADKDFLLNVMGFHHFHLGTTLEKGGFVTRTDEVLFGQVTRDAFHVLGIFDHTVFDDEDSNAMPAERKRLWHLHEERVFAGLPPGSFVVAGMIQTSGHPTLITLLAQRQAKLIGQLDPKLDDSVFVKSTLYRDADPAPSKKPKFRWAFRHLDLVLADDANQAYIMIQRGPG